MKKRKPRKPQDLSDLATLEQLTEEDGGDWLVFVRAKILDASATERLGNWLIGAAAWLKDREKNK